MSLEDEWGQSIKDAYATKEPIKDEPIDESVRYGSIIENPEETVYAKLMKNKTEGAETITFAKKDWAQLEAYLVDVQNQIIALSQLTPVKDAHGMCKATACQWGALSNEREKVSLQAVKLDSAMKLLDRLVGVLNRVFTEKLLAAEGWWGKEYAKVNRDIEDLKRM